MTSRCHINNSWPGTAAAVALLLSSLSAGAAAVAFWDMKPSTLSVPCVLDGHIDDAVQNLWSTNANGGSFATSSEVPPARMRARADDSGVSYDAGAIAGIDGALICPAAAHGDPFRFTGAFTVEMFFKTAGDKSSGGSMQLLLHGATNLRYGLTINDPAAGNLRFVLRDSAGQQHFCDLSTRNYADGSWHYVRATYDPASGTSGTIALMVLNENGGWDISSKPLPAAFQGLSATMDGNTHIGRNTYLKSQSPRTFLGLIDDVQISTGIVTGTNLLSVEPSVLARWNMSPTGGNFPCVLDLAAASGPQNLITFNGLGDSYPFSANVPPPTLFANGQTGGAHSFNAAAFASVSGALFYPQDVYGNAFSFQGGFAVELFFKTEGNQANAGFMELLVQGESFFRFGLIVNEPSPGNVRFAINDGQGHIPLVDLTARNYADGMWHYLMAKYSPEAGANGALVLTISNTDGTSQTATAMIDPVFAGLPGGNDGNMFIGRNVFASGSNARNFNGQIDEVQISSIGAPAAERLGAPPAPPLAGVGLVPGGGLGIHWPAQPGETYIVEYASNLGATPVRWSAIDIRTTSGGTQMFVDTDPARLSAPVGFYRVTLR